jgi:hypothetical protein
VDITLIEVDMDRCGICGARMPWLWRKSPWGDRWLARWSHRRCKAVPSHLNMGDGGCQVCYGCDLFPGHAGDCDCLDSWYGDMRMSWLWRRSPWGGRWLARWSHRRCKGLRQPCDWRLEGQQGQRQDWVCYVHAEWKTTYSPSDPPGGTGDA